METFYFTLDDKVQIWRRTRCEVQAESFKQALELVKKGDFDCIDSDFLYETEELMDPEWNGTEPTVEIYDMNANELYWSNKE